MFTAGVIGFGAGLFAGLLAPYLWKKLTNKIESA